MIWIEAQPWQNANDPSVHPVFRGKRSGHLMADSDEELVAYAVSIGLRRDWLQHGGTYRAHFDVVGIRLARVMRDPRVQKLDRRDWVARYQARMSTAIGRKETTTNAF